MDHCQGSLCILCSQVHTCKAVVGVWLHGEHPFDVAACECSKSSEGGPWKNARVPCWLDMPLVSCMRTTILLSPAGGGPQTPPPHQVRHSIKTQTFPFCLPNKLSDDWLQGTGHTWQEAIVDAVARVAEVDANHAHLLEEGGPVLEEGLHICCVLLHSTSDDELSRELQHQ